MYVQCHTCGKRCQSGKCSWRWHGSEKRYRCRACTRKLLKGAKVQILDVGRGTIR